MTKAQNKKRGAQILASVGYLGAFVALLAGLTVISGLVVLDSLRRRS